MQLHWSRPIPAQQDSLFTAASVASGRHSRPRAGARDGTSLLAMIIASVWAVLFILASLLLGINLYTVRRPSRREESAFIYLTRRHFAMDGCGCFARLLRSSSSSTSSSSRRPRRRVPSRPPSHRARRRVPIPPRGAADHDARGLIPGPRQPARLRDAAQQAPRRGAFFTLVPIRPRRRGERRSLRTFAGVSLRPPLAFNPRPRRLSTPTDAFQLHPDFRLYRPTLTRARRTRREEDEAPRWGTLLTGPTPPPTRGVASTSRAPSWASTPRPRRSRRRG